MNNSTELYKKVLFWIYAQVIPILKKNNSQTNKRPPKYKPFGLEYAEKLVGLIFQIVMTEFIMNCVLMWKNSFQI
jgi:hypothetical protein